MTHKKANERQVGGSHYSAGTQHWDIVTEHQLNYFEGQITKYVMRARKKNGLQDLQKAAHFLEKYMEEWPKFNALPAAQIVMAPRLPDDVDKEYALQEEAAKQFQPDGFSGDGTNGYQCVACRQIVRARSPLSAAQLHTPQCSGVLPARAR